MILRFYVSVCLREMKEGRKKGREGKEKEGRKRRQGRKENGKYTLRSVYVMTVAEALCVLVVVVRMIVSDDDK